MIAHVCASTGWTWDYVSENIDLPRLGHLTKYWNQYPPLHVLKAAEMGYKAPSKAETKESDLDEAMNTIGGGTLSESEFEALLKEKGLL